MALDVAGSFTVRLLTGLGQWMEDRGLGTWDPGTAYAASADEVVIRADGARDTPDRTYSLQDYLVADEVRLNDSTIGIQVLCRGTTDRRVALAMADALFDLLHGAEALVLKPTPSDGGIYVVQAYRRSGVSLGQDGNRRWEQSENYYLDVSRPSTHRND